MLIKKLIESLVGKHLVIRVYEGGKVEVKDRQTDALVTTIYKRTIEDARTVAFNLVNCKDV